MPKRSEVNNPFSPKSKTHQSFFSSWRAIFLFFFRIGELTNILKHRNMSGTVSCRLASSPVHLLISDKNTPRGQQDSVYYISQARHGLSDNQWFRCSGVAHMSPLPTSSACRHASMHPSSCPRPHP